MRIDEYGTCIYQEEDLFKLLYNDTVDFSDILIERSSDIDKLIEFSSLQLNEYKKSELSFEEFDKNNQNIWFVPDEYRNFDIYEFCMVSCDNEEQLIRCYEELVLFEKLNMIPLLGVLKYIVDTLRANNTLWGVGRGSSVASYVLYKLGVHRIDSMKYELDYKEFLRIGE